MSEAPAPASESVAEGRPRRGAATPKAEPAPAPAANGDASPEKEEAPAPAPTQRFSRPSAAAPRARSPRPRHRPPRRRAWTGDDEEEEEEGRRRGGAAAMEHRIAARHGLRTAKQRTVGEVRLTCSLYLTYVPDATETPFACSSFTPTAPRAPLTEDDTPPIYKIVAVGKAHQRLATARERRGKEGLRRVASSS